MCAGIEVLRLVALLAADVILVPLNTGTRQSYNATIIVLLCFLYAQEFDCHFLCISSSELFVCTQLLFGVWLHLGSLKTSNLNKIYNNL